MQTFQVDERKVLSRYEAKTKRSAELFRMAAEVTPGGVMGGIKFFEPYPIFMKRARGAHLWDVDGNGYIDYLMSYGALILGHGAEQARKGAERVLGAIGTTVFGTPTELESEYGARLRDIYHKGGLVRFTNSGLEATLLAARLAKGHTGRRKVAKFEGHYHGAVDHFLFSYLPDVGRAGSPESPSPIGDSVDIDDGIVADSIVLPFNNWPATEKKLLDHGSEIACVIMEPFEEGVIPAEATFMASLRRLTSDLKIPLIFDEVKTGFRVRFGGATEFYGVVPDLTCLGKIIGGGFPIGAVVGDREIMGQLDPRRGIAKRVFHSGTYNGNPLSLTAGMATVNRLGRKGTFESLRKKTDAIRRGYARELSRRGLPHDFQGEGAMFNFYITRKKVKNYRDVKASDLRLRRLVDLELICRGVYLKPEGRYSVSVAHTEEDARSTVERFGAALDAIVRPSR